MLPVVASYDEADVAACSVELEDLQIRKLKTLQAIWQTCAPTKLHFRLVQSMQYLFSLSPCSPVGNSPLGAPVDHSGEPEKQTMSSRYFPIK